MNTKFKKARSKRAKNLYNMPSSKQALWLANKCDPFPSGLHADVKYFVRPFAGNFFFRHVPSFHKIIFVFLFCSIMEKSSGYDENNSDEFPNFELNIFDETPSKVKRFAN